MESEETHCSTTKPQQPTTTVIIPDSVITPATTVTKEHLDHIQHKDSANPLTVTDKHVEQIQHKDSETVTDKQVEHSQHKDVGVPRSIHYEDYPPESTLPTLLPNSPTEPPPATIVEVTSVTVTSFNRPRKQSTTSVASSLAKGTALLCFRMSDVAVSLLVLLPLTIAMWRGIWEVMDAYTEPWVSIVLGNGMLLAQYGFQEPIKAFVALPPKMNFVLFYALSRTLLFAHAFAQINIWRGLWELIDRNWGMHAESCIITLVAGMAGLIVIKALCNVLATPMLVGVDEASSIHDCQLAFQTPISSKWKYLLDVMWSVILIQNLVVLAWRGLWDLLLLLIYPDPDDLILSCIVCMALGAAICIILSILQPCYFRFMIKLRGVTRLAVFDLVTTWAFIACVLTWRGNWDIYNLVTPFGVGEEVQVYNEWFLLVVGTLGTMVLGCLSTVAARGITVDGEDSGDGSSEWPISYISLLQKKRHHGIPFPEPWLLRYLFTSERMLLTEPLTQRRRSSAVGPTSAHFSLPQSQYPTSKHHEDEGHPHPLKLKPNSIYVEHFDIHTNSGETRSNRDDNLVSCEGGVRGQTIIDNKPLFTKSNNQRPTSHNVPKKPDNGNKIC